MKNSRSSPDAYNWYLTAEGCADFSTAALLRRREAEVEFGRRTDELELMPDCKVNGRNEQTAFINTCWSLTFVDFG